MGACPKIVSLSFEKTGTCTQPQEYPQREFVFRINAINFMAIG
jgi:hypothetical protein